MRGLGSAQLLREKFGDGPNPVVVRAPGRVNLIGEHTDYNEGFVLPFAIDRYTEVALRPRQDKYILVYSSVIDDEFAASLPLHNPNPQGKWFDYLVGILLEFANFKEMLYGFEAVIVSDVPIGAGMSSSASLEVAFALGLAKLYDVAIVGVELAQLCQRAENKFVGMPCGIMDQYVAYFAEADKALFLDTRTLQHRMVPLNLPGVAFLVIDSTVRRALSGSGYAERHLECETAARWLAREYPDRQIKALRDVDKAMLQTISSEMPPNLWRRAKHVVEENARVLAAVEALDQSDAERLGGLLFSSHKSLRELFDVSTPELDFLVKWAEDHGALGARLVGGGFGGVTLHLVPHSIKNEYLKNLAQTFHHYFDRKIAWFEVRPSPGARFFSP